MKVDFLISGFGGQGIMSLGRVLARVAVWEEKHTVFFPSYGAEMRGGTAHCFVKISTNPIASPFIEYPDVAIIFNQPSLDKFKRLLKKGSLVILNSDLTPRVNLAQNIKVVSLPLNRMALEAGNIKVANVIALGVLAAIKPKLLKPKTIISVLKEALKAKPSLVEANLRGFRMGREV